MHLIGSFDDIDNCASCTLGFLCNATVVQAILVESQDIVIGSHIIITIFLCGFFKLLLLKTKQKKNEDTNL